MRTQTTILTALCLLCCLAAPFAHAADPKAVAAGTEVLKASDARRQKLANLKAAYIVLEKRKDQQVAREMVVYVSAPKRALTVYFTKPKGDAGSGYLRIEQNLWSFDRNTGRWERRTEREEIGGTNVRRSDLDVPRLAEEFDVEDYAQEKVGSASVHRLTLKAKEGVDVAYPRMKLWLDKDLNEIKTEDYALSGKLLRTSTVKKLMAVKLKTGEAITLPKDTALVDAVDTTRASLLSLQAVEPGEVPPETFSKGWLESKTR